MLSLIEFTSRRQIVNFNSIPEISIFCKVEKHRNKNKNLEISQQRNGNWEIAAVK